MSRTLLVCVSVVLTVALCAIPEGSQGAQDDAAPAPKNATGGRKPAGKKRGSGKKGAAKTAPAEAPAPKAEPAAAANDGDLKFSKDIAPIIVNNCLGCHNDKLKRGKLDLTTFGKMMEGTPKEKIIVPGKPDESHLVLRIRGEETPKMPQGGNRNLSDEAVAKIEQWVKAGAILDKGIDKTALLESYASTPEQLRLASLAKMKPDERDKLVEAKGMERWKKSNKVEPQVTVGKNFILFGLLPKTRAEATLKAMDRQYELLKSLLGPKPVTWGEKASLYIFNDRNSLVEFARTIDKRELEDDEAGLADFSIAEPYVAVVDPYKGNEEPAMKRIPRSKRDEYPAAPDRSLIGLLTEQFAIGTVNIAGKPPRWISLGLGAHLSSRIDPRSPYFGKLRATAFDLAEQGWPSKANDALGGQTKPEEIRAVGFTILDWLSSTASPYYGQFVRGMLEGGEKLDEVIDNVLNGTREQFLTGSGQFVEAKYGRRR